MQCLSDPASLSHRFPRSLLPRLFYFEGSLWLHWAQPDSLTQSTYFKVNWLAILICNCHCPLPCSLTHSQVRGLGKRHLWGTGTLFRLPQASSSYVLAPCWVLRVWRKQTEYALSRKITPSTNIYEGFPVFWVLFQTPYVCVHLTNIKPSTMRWAVSWCQGCAVNKTHKSPCPHGEDTKQKKMNVLVKKILWGGCFIIPIYIRGNWGTERQIISLIFWQVVKLDFKCR